MLDKFQNLHASTSHLFDLVQKNPAILTDDEFNDILKTIDQRQILILEITSINSEEERNILAAIVEMNKVIDAKLVEIKKYYHSKVIEQKKKGQSNKQYMEYSNAGAASYFFDRKN